jgi:RimJ/RimL family protein N-acetyltransferase
MNADGSYRPMAFELSTARLSLRLRQRHDAAWNLQLLGEQVDGPRPTLAQVEHSLVEQDHRARQTGIGLLTIRRRAEGDAIGYCGLVIGRASFDEPELAYELLRRAHGQGYATEAAAAVLAAAFATGRQRIWATVRPWNAPSLRVLDKLGFRRDHVETDERGEIVYLVRDAAAG